MISQNQIISHALARCQDKYMITKKSPLVIAFGCCRCDWKNTPSCPFREDSAFIRMGHHSNWFCSERMKYIQTLVDTAGSLPKALQIEEVAKTVMLINKMIADGNVETGDAIHPQLHQLQRNLIKLLSDMRKQDEGIKIQGEISHVFEEYDKMVEAHAKVINEERQNNGSGLAELPEKV